MSTEMLDNFCQSQFWDANLTWNTDNPDFTPCFQQTVLVWVPCSIPWIFLPLGAALMAKRKPTHLRWSSNQIIKSILVLLLLSLSVFKFGREIYLGDFLLVEYTASAIKLSAYVLVFLQIVYGRNIGCISSGIQTLFWLLSTIAETLTYRSTLMHFRTKYTNDGFFGFAIETFSYPLVITTFILNTLTDTTPFYHKNHDGHEEKKSPEEEASVCSRITHSWLSSTMWKGWKNSLEPSDILELNHSEKVLTASKHLEKRWKYQPPKRVDKDLEMKNLLNDSRNVKESQRNSIFLPLLKTAAPCLLTGALFQIFSDVVSYGSPHVLRWIINHSSNEEPVWKGIFYACLMGLIGVAQSLLLEVSSIFNIKVGIRLKSITMHALYKKTLRLSSSNRDQPTIGKLLNTMYVDTDRFLSLAEMLSGLWSSPVNLILCFYFLHQELGTAAFAGLAMVFLIIPVNYAISKKIRQLEILLMKIKDKRVKMMSEILNGIRVLKLYAWETSFEDIITSIRKKEIALIKKQTVVSCARIVMFLSLPIWITISSFVAFVMIDKTNVLTSTKAFVSLLMIRTASVSLFLLPNAITTLEVMKVAISRINKVLNSEEAEQYVSQIPPNSEYSIKISDATFRWNSEETTYLRNINLVVPRGALVAVIGPVGSGKSSLLTALLCAMEKLEGELSVTGRVGYVSQQPWIQNTTLRNNVLFINEMDESRYNRILDACALRYDLNTLPAHDETEIGERGINLSGGQKQRVSIARTVYQDADIYLLDDPLGAVDSHVDKHIFNEVIGPNGLLREKTRVLVTHNLTFLRDVDEIYFMNHGEIIERGTYEQIMEREGVAREYFAKHIEEEKGKEEIQLNQLQNKSKSHKNVRDETDATLVTKETVKKGTTSFSVYRRYSKSFGFFWFGLFFVFLLVVPIVQQGSNYWLSLWSEDRKEGDTVDYDQRTKRVTVFGVLSLTEAAVNFASFMFGVFGTLQASKRLHENMLHRVLRSPASFFDTTPTGRILNRFSQDVDALDKQLYNSIKNSLTTTISVLSLLAVLTIVLPALIIPAIAVMAGYTLFQRFFMASNRQIKRIVATKNSFLYSHVSDSVAGTAIIRASRAGNRFEAQFIKLIDQNMAVHYMMRMSGRWLTVRFNILGQVLMFCASLFTVLSKGAFSPGIVGFLITNAIMLITRLRWFITTVTKLETDIVSAERIYEYCELTSEAEWEKPEVKLSSDWPERGQIIFHNYSAKYREGLDPVLKDVNLTIEAGEKVGVVGRTGAGKSTMTLALFRLIEAFSGYIRVDGVTVGQLGLKDARSRLTIIPQDPVLFSGTLRLNLDPFQAYPDHALHDALQHAHLRDFVKSLPEGLEHPVAEGGRNLSVGQRQLVCLARALLRRTRILVLDEATASVDMDTDDLIQTTIRKEFASSTVITIAHRINTIMDYDRVIVLDQGRIAEFDTPKNLLNNNQSLFYALAKDAKLL